MLEKGIVKNKRAVLFDMDGTLIDSNDAHTQSWVESLEHAGHKTSFEAVRPLIGMGSDKIIPKLINVTADSVEGENIKEYNLKCFTEKLLSTLKPFSQSRELCQFVIARGLKVVIASSANPKLLDKLIEVANVKDLIDEQTSSGDAKQSKPDPDILSAALKKADLDASDVIFIGDTPYDIQAAAKLGVPTIALRCGGHWSDDDLNGAIHISDSPSSLLQDLNIAF